MCGTSFQPPADLLEELAAKNLAVLYDTKDVNPVCIDPRCECRA